MIYLTAIRYLQKGNKVKRSVTVRACFIQPIPSSDAKYLPDKLIECSYDDTMARVKTEDGLTEAVLILAGVLQGDTLIPY